MTYTRINIYLTAKQKKALMQLADSSGVKFSELVRAAITEYLEGRERSIR